MTLSGPYYTTESRASSQILSMPTSKAGRELRETPTPRSQQTGQIASEIYGRQSGAGLMFLARRPELTGQVLGGVRRPSHARETLLQKNRGPRPVRRGPEVLSLRLDLLDSGCKSARGVSQEGRDRAEGGVTGATDVHGVASDQGLGSQERLLAQSKRDAQAASRSGPVQRFAAIAVPSLSVGNDLSGPNPRCWPSGEAMGP